MRWRGDVEGERGFQVRLLEVRIHPAGIGWLEVGVAVDPTVGRIGGPVHALGVEGVRTIGDDPQFVAGCQAR